MDRPLEGRTGCRQAEPRPRASCLTKIEDAAVIPELLAIAREAGTETAPARTDFRFAAENAGRVGARTSTDRLVQLVQTGDGVAQQFGLVGLGHALSLLRMGYAQGGDRDTQHLARIVGPTGDVCAERLAAHDPSVVEAAFGCLAKTEDERHGPAIVDAVVAHAHQSALAKAGVRALTHVPYSLETARPLVRLLEDPMPDHWLSSDVGVRADVCDALSRKVRSTDRWAQLPAATAAQRIGDKNSQARGRCETLARKAGAGAASDPAPAPFTRDWFTTYPLERCRVDRYGILGHAELCVESLPAGEGARRFEMTLADTSKLDPRDSSKHAEIVATTISAGPGEYVEYELVASYELSDGAWLIVVPIVLGVPDAYRAKYTQLYALDTATKRLILAHTTAPCRGADCRQDVQLRRKPDALPIEIRIEGSPSERLDWNGRQLVER